jgi:hypothetical protein
MSPSLALLRPIVGSMRVSASDTGSLVTHRIGPVKSIVILNCEILVAGGQLW